MSVRDVLAANDVRFLAMARGLDDGQWAAPSLCAEWTNHEVLAHLVLGRSAGPGSMVAEMLKRRGSFDAANTAMARRLAAARTPSDLLADFAAPPRGMGRYFPNTLFLGDHVTHELDIRFALGLEPTVAPAALVAVLNAQVHLPNSFVPAYRNSRGLRLVAPDIGWVHGSGTEVVGPAAALVSVLASRPAALAHLAGDGVAVLSRRTAA
jgi:uncharacterized protein (TIGR03083 family)